MSPKDIQGKRTLGREISKCSGPEVGVCLSEDTEMSQCVQGGGNKEERIG